MTNPVQARLKSANLVDDLEQLERLLGDDWTQRLHLQVNALKESHIMNNRTTTRPKTRGSENAPLPPRRRARPVRLIVAATMATVIAAVIGAVILTAPEVPDQVAGPDQSDAAIAALSAAESFVEAHGTGDVATIEGLLVERLRGDGPIGMQFEGAGTGSVEYRVASTVARQTALGLIFTDGSCRIYSETPLVVTCNYMATSRVHDIDGTAPNPATFTFHFEDALISEVTLVCHLSTPSFDEFMRQHGPLTGADAPSDPYDRLRVYVDLYEASVRGSG